MIRRILKTEQHEHHRRTKGQTRTYNMIRTILKTEQHEHHRRTKGQTRTYNMIRTILKTDIVGTCLSFSLSVEFVLLGF
jgi:hypothetical protein